MLGSPRCSVILMMALLLQGCVAPYNFSKDEKTAQLVSLAASSPLICVDDQVYSVTKDSKKGNFIIPANRRITIIGYGFFDSYPVTYTCRPEISLIPGTDETYLMDLHILRNACILDVVRESETAPTGLRRELTLGPSICNPRRKSTLTPNGRHKSTQAERGEPQERPRYPG